MEKSVFFYANDPDIARVTFTVGDTTKDAVRPEADRPFWHLIESFLIAGRTPAISTGAMPPTER